MARRTFEQVSVGETFGPTQVPIGRAGLVDYANASGDQNPIHQDEAFARSVGLPDVIAHGMWTMGATSSVLAQWVGDAGAVLGIGTRFTKPVVVPVDGSAIEVAGVVKSVDEQERTATVELTTTCGADKVLGRCQARVQLA